VSGFASLEGFALQGGMNSRPYGRRSLVMQRALKLFTRKDI